MSCSHRGEQYQIGVSQCSADIWREKQNAELRIGAYCYDDIKLRFAAAYDSDERQVQQIDSLIGEGIDLLVVAPNQVQTISPAIDRAYDQGIPVIVFERKTSSKKFTAFISADNYEMGHQMGSFIAHRLGGKGQVMEVMGLQGSSPAIERHEGFVAALKDFPGIRIVATLRGDWTEKSGYDAVRNYKGDLSNVDFVFAQNDRMAMGARKALLQRYPNALTRYCGIDGLPGEGGGIQLVIDSILDATYIYPTHGDQIIQLAVDILEGKPYKKETLLKSALVTRDNASVLLMQSEEIMQQSSYIDLLHEKADSYLQKFTTQRTVTLLACIAIVLLLLVIVLFYLYHIGKVTLRQEREVNVIWNMKTPEAEATSPTAEAGVSPSVEQSSSQPDTSEETVATGGGFFISRFKATVEARLADSDLSVEDLAAEMNLSRVQLYRKVKAITGATPNELLRTARLNRAYELLVTTDHSISEIAYKVGFTAPSYFSKCFKDEYGKLPGDLRA